MNPAPQPLPANSALAVNGGTLDLNAKNISINNILDNGSTGGVITNNGANGTTSTVTFTGSATDFGGGTGSYNMYAALNDGASGGKVALVSTINNANAGTYSLALHATSTYSGGTTITRQSVDAYATNALGTGPVVVVRAREQELPALPDGVEDEMVTLVRLARERLA